MGGVDQAPSRGDNADRLRYEAAVDELAAAVHKPAAADPLGDRSALALEQFLQVARRDVVGSRHYGGAELRVVQTFIDKCLDSQGKRVTVRLRAHGTLVVELFGKRGGDQVKDGGGQFEGRGHVVGLKLAGEA